MYAPPAKHHGNCWRTTGEGQPAKNEQVVMPDIMIRCPVMNKDVPTGLTTEAIKFESIEDGIAIPFRCPACLKLHTWERKQAWIKE